MPRKIDSGYGERGEDFKGFLAAADKENPIQTPLRKQRKKEKKPKKETAEVLSTTPVLDNPVIENPTSLESELTTALDDIRAGKTADVEQIPAEEVVVNPVSVDVAGSETPPKTAELPPAPEITNVQTARLINKPEARYNDIGVLSNIYNPKNHRPSAGEKILAANLLLKHYKKAADKARGETVAKINQKITELSEFIARYNSHNAPDPKRIEQERNQEYNQARTQQLNQDKAEAKTTKKKWLKSELAASTDAQLLEQQEPQGEQQIESQNMKDWLRLGLGQNLGEKKGAPVSDIEYIDPVKFKESFPNQVQTGPTIDVEPARPEHTPQPIEAQETREAKIIRRAGELWDKAANAELDRMGLPEDEKGPYLALPFMQRNREASILRALNKFKV